MNNILVEKVTILLLKCPQFKRSSVSKRSTILYISIPQIKVSGNETALLVFLYIISLHHSFGFFNMILKGGSADPSILAQRFDAEVGAAIPVCSLFYSSSLSHLVMSKSPCGHALIRFQSVYMFTPFLQCPFMIEIITILQGFHRGLLLLKNKEMGWVTRL